MRKCSASRPLRVPLSFHAKRRIPPFADARGHGYHGARRFAGAAATAGLALSRRGAHRRLPHLPLLPRRQVGRARAPMRSAARLGAGRRVRCPAGSVKLLCSDDGDILKL